MPTPVQVVRRGLTQYPILFPTPLSVLDHVFCVAGGGYEWRKGELVDVYEPKYVEAPMKYDDLDDREEDNARRIAERDSEYMSPLYTTFALESECLRNQRKWVEDNLDRILSARLVSHYGNGSKHAPMRGKTKEISLTYNNALNFPDDITKAWGDVLWEYLDHWLVTLNVVYMIGSARDIDESIKHWPDAIKVARKAILAAQERLYPLLHNGKSYKEHRAESARMVLGMLDEIKAGKLDAETKL
jgi:hypothetical protein